MVEMPMGVRAHEHRSLTRSKDGGSLAFAYSKDGWWANTVGHTLAVPIIHLPLLTLKDSFKSPKEELVQTLKDRWKDVPWKGDTLVRVGHASFAGDIQRLLAKDDEVKGRAIFSTTSKHVDRVARYLYIPFQLLNTAMAKTLRTNWYDPITNTASIYHPDKALGMAEIGAAKFFDKKKNPTGWAFFSGFPVIRSMISYGANKNAMPQFKTDEERKSALKIMEPRFSSTLIQDVSYFARLPFVDPLATLVGGFASGHIASRMPGLRVSDQYQRFGYVFEGKDPKKDTKYFHGPHGAQESAKQSHDEHSAADKHDLKDHQVYVSSARAMRPITGNSARRLF